MGDTVNSCLILSLRVLLRRGSGCFFLQESYCESAASVAFDTMKHKTHDLTF